MRKTVMIEKPATEAAGAEMTYKAFLILIQSQLGFLAAL